MRPPFPLPAEPFLPVKLVHPAKPVLPVTPILSLVLSQPTTISDRHPHETQRKLKTNEVSMLQEVIKECQANEEFRLLKSVEKVKAVFEACPPSLQINVNSASGTSSASSLRRGATQLLCPWQTSG
jgi:hypothetical protein